jgi:hypothetical protein
LDRVSLQNHGTGGTHAGAAVVHFTALSVHSLFVQERYAGTRPRREGIADSPGQLTHGTVGLFLGQEQALDAGSSER